MELNQTTLAGILAQILSVSQDHVVPKQGNWWNPQENQQNIENWCAFLIKSNRPRTAPFYDTATNGQTNAVCVEKIAEIDLQFVGPQSEDLAQSVAMWPLRADVKAAFKTVQGALMYDDMTAVSSPFYQDGQNTVTAWNVPIRVLWISVMETGQGQMPPVSIYGKVIKK